MACWSFAQKEDRACSFGCTQRNREIISAYGPWPKPWANNIQQNIRGLRHSDLQAGLHLHQNSCRTLGKVNNWDPVDTQLSASHYHLYHHLNPVLCWRHVEMSDWGPCTKVKLTYLWCWALGVTAHQDGATCHPLTGLGTLTPTGLVGVPGAQDQVLWRQKNQRQYWTVTPLWSCSLQEFISSIRKSEESSSNLCGLRGKKYLVFSFFLYFSQSQFAFLL